MRLLIAGGRVVDPGQGLDARLDVLLEGGVVARLGEAVTAGGARVIDAAGLVVAPGLIDPHVHLREPGFEHRETVRSGLAAAAAGGYTAVACTADTSPVHDSRAVTEQILAAAARHPWARVYPIGALSRGRAGEELAEMGDMVAGGAVAFSDAGRPVVSPMLLRRALQHARHYGAPVVQQPEDPLLAADGVMHEGEWSTRLGLPGIPALAEEVMVARDLLLAEETGGRLHLAHLSTRRGLALVREARARGVGVTCSVTPHHLLLTDREVARRSFDTATKTRPPLRSAADLEALRQGLADGTVDAIASDHAPFHGDEKDVPFSAAPFGAVGLETTVSLCLDRLVRPGLIGLSRLVELLSAGPARVLGVPGGSLVPGQPADLTLLDLERSVTVDSAAFSSLSHNTPFDGWQLRGAAAATVVGGRPVELPTP